MNRTSAIRQYFVVRKSKRRLPGGSSTQPQTGGS